MTVTATVNRGIHKTTGHGATDTGIPAAPAAQPAVDLTVPAPRRSEGAEEQITLLYPETDATRDRAGYRATAFLEMGACREIGSDHFFPEPGQPSTVALNICASCDVLEQCRDWALWFESKHRSMPGVYGGLTESQRRRKGVRRDPICSTAGCIAPRPLSGSFCAEHRLDADRQRHARHDDARRGAA